MISIIGTLCFALALLHTFSVKHFQKWARRYPEGSVPGNFFHLLGEVEIVFGLWAAVFLVVLGLSEGSHSPVEFLQARNFTEPVFVFVIMTVCSSRPLLKLSETLIETLSRLLPFKRSLSFYATTLTIGPLLGSFITEPAAMTVTALILLERFYSQNISTKLKYTTLGVLFVNISVGGTLTPYAAPPVLMVAGQWNWDLKFMFLNFGWKAILVVVASTLFATYRFRKELSEISWTSKKESHKVLPHWITALHLAALVAIVLSAHYIEIFVGIFLFFLGFATVTKEFQSRLQVKEGLLVAFFLGGLVVLGAPQRWWLQPILESLNALPLYLGAAALTSVTDNAALTYLGSQVPTLQESSRYALVAGSVVGGGLTVIANAPNPAGYGILNSSFGKEGISPLSLFTHALIPTLIALTCFWFL